MPAKKKSAPKAAAPAEPQASDSTPVTPVSTKAPLKVYRADLGEGLPPQVSQLNPDRAK